MSIIVNMSTQQVVEKNFKMSRRISELNELNPMDKLLMEKFTNLFRPGYVLVGDENICLPTMFKAKMEKLEEFQVENSDVWVISHPKCGTTWTQEMVWLIANNLDYNKANIPLSKRFPQLELECIFDYTSFASDSTLNAPDVLTDSLNVVKNLERPRFIKSHLPWCLLPKELREGTKNSKIVYAARNPKDACSSYYHYSRSFEGFTGNYEEFCQLFIAGKLMYGPFWTNTLSYWERRNQPNVLFLRYEDMKNDLPSVIKQTASFLDKELSDDQIKDLVKHLSFESMKSKEGISYAVNVNLNQSYLQNGDNGSFFRSGKIGSYKDDMSVELERQFDDWINENNKYD